MNPFILDFSSITDIPAWLLVAIITWTLLWKGLSLWKAARRDSPTWFVALLIINTVGILEILYYYLFSEMKLDETEKEKPKRARQLFRPKKAFLDS